MSRFGVWMKSEVTTLQRQVKRLKRENLFLSKQNEQLTHQFKVHRLIIRNLQEDLKTAEKQIPQPDADYAKGM